MGTMFHLPLGYRRGHVRRGLENEFEVFIGFDSVLLLRFNDAVEHNASGRALGRVAEQPVLATDCKRTNAAFRAVAGNSRYTPQS